MPKSNEEEHSKPSTPHTEDTAWYILSNHRALSLTVGILDLRVDVINPNSHGRNLRYDVQQEGVTDVRVRVKVRVKFGVKVGVKVRVKVGVKG